MCGDSAAQAPNLLLPDSGLVYSVDYGYTGNIRFLYIINFHGFTSNLNRICSVLYYGICIQVWLSVRARTACAKVNAHVDHVTWECAFRL